VAALALAEDLPGSFMRLTWPTMPMVITFFSCLKIQQISGTP
jgi:hypothetical protein